MDAAKPKVEPHLKKENLSIKEQSLEVLEIELYRQVVAEIIKLEKETIQDQDQDQNQDQGEY